MYSFCERTLNTGMVKSKIFRKLSLNFTFGQGSCLISNLAVPNSNKALLLQISLKLVVFFNNHFAFCMAGLLEPVVSCFSSVP